MSESPLLRSPRGESPERAAGDGDEEDDLENDADALQLERYMRDRRRTKSLPAYPEDVEGINGHNGRKRVTFADSMGLNLASVKHFSSLEEPKIPSKVLARLKSFPPRQQQQLAREDLDGLCASFNSRLSAERLFACFLPVAGEDLETRVKTSRVALETITVTQFDVRGQIRVFTSGDCPWKEVGVRYTFNDWLSNVDAQALPVPVGSCREPVGECFSFTMYTPPFMDTSSAVHFAVYLRSEEGEFWDNNDGQNYTLRYHCVPDVAPFVSAAFHAT